MLIVVNSYLLPTSTCYLVIRMVSAAASRVPASSAGVERMFSKAGKLYGDDKKGREQDDTLEAMLFAAANAD